MTLFHQSTVMRVSWNEKQELERIFFLFGQASHVQVHSLKKYCSISQFFTFPQNRFQREGIQSLCCKMSGPKGTGAYRVLQCYNIVRENTLPPSSPVLGKLITGFFIIPRPSNGPQKNNNPGDYCAVEARLTLLQK